MQHKTSYPQSIVAIVGILVGVMALGQTARAQSRVFPPDSSPFNKTFGEWSAEWWQFVLSIPVPENPLLDDTGARCTVGQHGPVWFLAGAFGGTVTRTCSIPEGKALFVPIINSVDINTAKQTAAELRAEIAPCLDSVTTLSVAVDGKRTQDLEDEFRVRSVVFDATFPENGFLSPGTYSPVVDDGFYVMVKPLPVGSHTLHLRGAWQGCPAAPGPFSVDVMYNLTIVPVSLR